MCKVGQDRVHCGGGHLGNGGEGLVGVELLQGG